MLGLDDFKMKTNFLFSRPSTFRQRSFHMPSPFGLWSSCHVGLDGRVRSCVAQGDGGGLQGHAELVRGTGVAVHAVLVQHVQLEHHGRVGEAHEDWRVGTRRISGNHLQS